MDCKYHGPQDRDFWIACYQRVLDEDPLRAWKTNPERKGDYLTTRLISEAKAKLEPQIDPDWKDDLPWN